MADRSAYRQHYQHQVAELGGDDEEFVSGEEEIVAARQLVQDCDDGLIEDGSKVEKAREMIRRYDEQAALIRKVQLTVCAHSHSAAEAQDLMEYLGIAPNQPMLSGRVFFSPTTMPDAATTRLMQKNW